MKTSRILPLYLSLLLALTMGLQNCKKTEPDPVKPGTTTTPGSTTTTPGSGTTTTTTTKSAAKDLTTFSFNALSPAVSATIDASAKIAKATVPATTDVTKLVPTLTVSDKATVSPASGVAQDFSKAISYTVTAEDGSQQTYVVTVTKAASLVCRVVSSDLTYSSGTTSKVTYSVDAQNRLILVKSTNLDKNGTVTSSDNTVYTYDADGFQTSNIRNYTYTTPGQYDAKETTNTYTYQGGRLVKSVSNYVYVDPARGFGSTTVYEYNAQGKVSKRFLTSSSGQEDTYTYANELVTNITGNKTTYVLNAQGFITKRTNDDGTYATYQYNAAGQQTTSESYNAKGVKTGYTTTEYTTTTYKQPINPGYVKELPTVPSANGVNGGPLAKFVTYAIDASGKETKSSETTYTYQVDSKGNLVSSTYNYVATNFPSSSTTTYQYEGCQ